MCLTAIWGCQPEYPAVLAELWRQTYNQFIKKNTFIRKFTVYQSELINKILQYAVPSPQENIWCIWKGNIWSLLMICLFTIYIILLSLEEKSSIQRFLLALAELLTKSLKSVAQYRVTPNKALIVIVVVTAGCWQKNII